MFGGWSANERGYKIQDDKFLPFVMISVGTILSLLQMVLLLQKYVSQKFVLKCDVLRKKWKKLCYFT